MMCLKTNYMTYETYFKITKTIVDDPRYEKSKANKSLGKFLSLHPHNLAQKTQIIIEHFRDVTKNKIMGKAKAMVVTSSRLHAVRYYKEFEKYIKKMGYQEELNILIAFSGTVQNNEEDYTEASMNKINETELPEKFSSSEYQILLVAEKYQTGFDEPLLHTMFVDKKLSGVKAVQTLSRLNRTCYGKEDTFILDFVNSADDIRKAFEPYYEQTTIQETIDANVVYDIKTKLDEFRVYNNNEIKAFSKSFFKSEKTQNNLDFSILNGFVDPAVNRYKNLEENDQDEFKCSLIKFIRNYSFVTGIICLNDIDMHKFFAYAKYLIKKLPKQNQSKLLFLDDEVSLQYYRIQKIFEGSISLNKSNPLENFIYSGKSKPEEVKANLSELVENLNNRFSTNFTKEDMLIVEQFIFDMDNNKELQTQAQNNPVEHFRYTFNDTFMNIVVDRMNQNQSFCERILDDEKFGNRLKDFLIDVVYERLRELTLS